MKAFIVTSIICFILYLLLTTGSGTEILGLWSIIELGVGILLSVITGFIAQKVFIKNSYRMLNPVRWVLFLGYIIGPFFFALLKANLDVAYRVITGLR
jgi:multicomponent Na+:H+ antiporter subunit E